MEYINDFWPEYDENDQDLHWEAVDYRRARIHMKMNLSRVSFILIVGCIGISGYSLYSVMNNTWLVAPPNTFLLMLSIAAIVFGIKGFNRTNLWRKTVSGLTVILSVLMTILLCTAILITYLFGGKQEVIMTTSSPDKDYTIHFYRWDEGAMGTFGVRGELQGPLWFKKRIYLESRVDHVNVEWITHDTVSINKRLLNMVDSDTHGYE